LGVCIEYGKLDLKIIVEFCRHGNLEDILKSNRSTFVEIPFEKLLNVKDCFIKLNEIIGKRYI